MMSETTDLLEEFRAFVSAMPLTEEEYPSHKNGDWRYRPDPGFDDFNKEIADPGCLADFPDGAVAIRSDDDFWVEAVFPYRFRDLTIQQMVSVLWPAIENPTFHDDVSAYQKPGGRNLKETS